MLKSTMILLNHPKNWQEGYAALKDKSYVLTMAEQWHEQTMLEMDFSDNNKSV